LLTALERAGDLGGHPVGAKGDAVGDRLAHHEQIRLEAPMAGQPAGSRHERVGLVDDQQRTRSRDGPPQPGVEASAGRITPVLVIAASTRTHATS
jgi:hypothetical protein